MKPEFFHEQPKIIASFTTTLESNASGVGEKLGLISYQPDGFIYIITRIRFNYKKILGIENVLLTAKRGTAELDIFTDLKLGAIGSDLEKNEPLLDLSFEHKSVFIEISNSNLLTINSKSPILLNPKDISMTTFGYKLRK